MEVSDPARQLVAMCEWFAGYKHHKSNSRTIDALERLFKSNNRSETIRVISEANKRFDEYEKTIHSVGFDFLDERDRNDALDAAESTRQFLNFEAMMNTWTHYVGIAGNSATLNAIRIPSPVLRQLMPCLVPSEDDIHDMSLALNEISEEDLVSSAMPKLLEQAIRIGIEELRMSLRFPLVYGLEYIPHRAAHLSANLMMAETIDPKIKATALWDKTYRVLAFIFTVWIGFQPAVEATKYNFDEINNLYQMIDEKIPALLLEYKNND